MGRKVPEVNSSSTADMAFLLLIFFLMTTTMSVDSGIQRILPPMPPEDQKEQELDINKRNVLEVRVNQNNDLLVGGERRDVYQLKDRVVEFFLNPYEDPTLSDKEEKEIELIGKVMVSRGLVSLQNDRGTNYGAYIQVQNELTRALNEMRDAAARRYFNVSYNDLSEEQKLAINKVIPPSISEALPRTN